MKRVLTIQDMSSVGKCSLTVALPILSACGLEACPLPTAILSNHTAFHSFEFLDLTDNMSKMFDGYKKESIAFDGIYTGYLGSSEQVNKILDFVKENGNSFFLADPAMADNGSLYKGFDLAFVSAMRELCRKADIIVPNTTEASYLLGEDGNLKYKNKDDIKAQLSRLSELGVNTIVLTGVAFDDKLGTAIYKKATDELLLIMRKRIDAMFHGTGDIFASVLFGMLMQGKSIEDACELAVDFTCLAMSKTLADKNSRWYGVNFEEALPMLFKK